MSARAATGAAAAATATPQIRVLACCGGMVTFGGAERMTFTALAAARRAGARVHCIVNGWMYERIAEAAGQIGATWVTSAYRVRLDRRTRDPRALWRQLVDVARTNRDLLREARRLRATHVLVPSHDIVIRNFPALLLLRLFRVPVVMRLCNAPGADASQRRLWRRWVNPAVDRFVCNSTFTRAALVACGVPSSKTTLIYNALPVSRQEQVPAEPIPGRLIYVGQVIPPKGLHVLLDAMGQLVAGGADLTLDVVGEVEGWMSPAYGDYRERILARAARPDLAGRVRFLGWREDVQALMSRASLHCCPSLPEIRESFGIVVLEAKSAGVASVVLPSGALSEVVTHGVDGWVCDAATADALADTCRSALADPMRLRAMGEAARRSLERFSREAFDRRWQAVFEPAGSAAATTELEAPAPANGRQG
jgi:glycosyltransferase involved in cell wall biosynthesis